MKKYFWVFCLFILLGACKKEESSNFQLNESYTEVGTYKLAHFSQLKNTKYLVVFENGLGNDHRIWQQGNLLKDISAFADILLYDRAGYGKSGLSNAPRNLENLSKELGILIDTYAKGRKVILVGHSFGGMIIRAYATQNPQKTAALLFVDPSHEHYNKVTPEIQKTLYETLLKEYGANFGGTMEIKEFYANMSYLQNLPALPQVPTVILTGAKHDVTIFGDVKLWIEAHQILGKGLKDLNHLILQDVGHEIMVEKPELISSSVKQLIDKNP